MVKASDDERLLVLQYMYCTLYTVTTSALKKTRFQKKKKNIDKIYLHKLMVLTSATRLTEDVIHENIYFSC